MGIKYKGNTISQLTSSSNYPYYNGNIISQVYYNGKLIWKKYSALDYTFKGNSVTGYTGSGTELTIPSSYSYIQEPPTKNLFSYYDAVAKGTQTTGSGSYTGTNYYDSSFYYYLSSGNTMTIESTISFTANKRYTLSFDISSINNTATLSWTIYYNDGTSITSNSITLNTAAKSTRQAITLLPIAAGYKCVITVQAGTSSSQSATLKDFQIEENATATTYEAPNYIFVVGSDKTVTNIGNNAFENNSSITKVTIPTTITSIGSYAFSGCYNLSTLVLNHQLSTIYSYAFAATNLWDMSSPPANIYKANLYSGALATRTKWIIKLYFPAPLDDWSNYTDAIDGLDMCTYSDGTIVTKNNYTANDHIYVLDNFIEMRLGINSGSNAGGGTMYVDDITIAYGDGTTRSLGRTASDDFGTLESGVESWGGTYGDGYVTIFNGVGATRPTLHSVSRHTSTSNWSSVHTDDAQLCYTKYENGLSIDTKTTTFVHTCRTSEFGIIWEYHYNTTCLPEGTLITLADGSQKPIEEVTYSDLLKVYNFSTGELDYQYPLVLAKSQSFTITRIILEDDSSIDISHIHDIYDPVLHKFISWGNGNISSKDATKYHMLKLVDNKYTILKVKDIYTIRKKTDCYSCLTGGTITAIANNILIGSDFLNYTNITKENKFPESFAKDQELCYTYNRFKEEIYPKASKYLTLGLNLQYLHYYYDKNTTDYEQLFHPFINNEYPCNKEGKHLCTVGILDKGILTEKIYKEDEEIILPQIQEPDKTQWYIVGEYKYLQPGDKYKINFSTLIRAV